MKNFEVGDKVIIDSHALGVEEKIKNKIVTIKEVFKMSYNCISYNVIYNQEEHFINYEDINLIRTSKNERRNYEYNKCK